MLQMNRKPGESEHEMTAATTTPAAAAKTTPRNGHAVLVSALARESAVFSIIETACTAAGVVCYGLDEARRAPVRKRHRGLDRCLAA